MSSFDYHKQAQSYYAKSPTVILGSGASASFGMSSMWHLAEHLKKNINIENFEDDDEIQWTEFVGFLDDGVDLENALHNVHMSERLTNQIILSTWSLINSEDLAVFNSSLNQRDYFPLGRLLNSYFKSTAKDIDIVTTNYDRLIEYACEQEGFHHYTGFSHGYRRLLKEPNYLRCGRTVNIWKVHGSLDWFKSPSGEVIAFGNSNSVVTEFSPQIVTPGTEKYRITHLEPFRSIIANADAAIEKAESYLAVGFGFNDQHIQEKLIQKCVRDKSSITIVTYKLSDTAKKTIFEQGLENYLAIERGSNDDESIIYSSKLDTEIVVNFDCWSLNGYLNLII